MRSSGVTGRGWWNGEQEGAARVRNAAEQMSRTLKPLLSVAVCWRCPDPPSPPAYLVVENPTCSV